MSSKAQQMNSERFRPGKLDPSFLAALLARNRIGDPRVLLGPGVGRDAAVLDMGGGRCLVAKTDPITFATAEIGWYAVQVNANDVAAAGARPRWFLASVLLPDTGTTRELVETIHDDILRACRELEIELVGGHTEITAGLDRPIVVGQMLGEADRDRLVTPSGARPGDAVLLTKRIAVEGTAILGHEFGDRLGDADFAARCRAFLHKPGISVVRDAAAACAAGGVHAMHDPTEGGVATGLRELAEASGLGIRVRREAIPVYPETQRACEALGLNPLGLIASGSLLVVADPSRAGALIAALSHQGIECAQVGEMTAEKGNCRMILSEKEIHLPAFPRDEIASLYREG